MAAKLGIAVTTVQGWKERGSIPPARHAQILAAAEAEGLALSDSDLSAGGDDQPSARRGSSPAEAEEFSRETIEPDTIEPGLDEPLESIEPPEPELSPAYAVHTRPARSPARAALLGGLAGIVVAAGAGAAGWYMRDRTPAGIPPALSARIDAIAKRADAAETLARGAEARARTAETKLTALADLSGRLAAAEARARATEDKVTALAGLQERIKAGGGEEAARAVAAVKAELAQLAARLKATAPSEKLQALGAALSALKAQVNKLAARTETTAPAAAADMAALKKELATTQATLAGEIEKISGVLAGFGKRLAALDKRVAEPAQALSQRLSELEKRKVSAAGGRAAALIAAIGQLREAVRAGRPFTSELEAVEALGEKEPRLAGPQQRLAPHAGKGVPTAADLTASFGPAAPAIVRAGRMPEEGGWSARAWARLRSVVIVRRIGPGVEGADAEAVVARAEARLAAGDITGAAAMLKTLKGTAAEAARPWLAAAGAHMEAAQAVAALHRSALTLIEAPVKSKPPAEIKSKAAP